MNTFLQWLITEGTVKTLSRVIPKSDIESYKDQLSRSMPKGKVKHSLRVGGTLAKVGAGAHLVKAAIWHDYLERKGKRIKLERHLGPESVSLVKALSSDSKAKSHASRNEPLDHAKTMLNHPSMTPESKNDFVMVKMSDRLDNLKRRSVESGIGPNYARKSKDLVTHLLGHYSGDHEPVNSLRKKFKQFGVNTSRQDIGAFMNPLWMRTQPKSRE